MRAVGVGVGVAVRYEGCPASVVHSIEESRGPAAVPLACVANASRCLPATPLTQNSLLLELDRRANIRTVPSVGGVSGQPME